MKQILLVLFLALPMFAQRPVPIMPTGITQTGPNTFSGTVMDTTYSLPTGGTTIAAHNAGQFTTALTTAVPGDVIVLDAGVTYAGSFTLPVKSNPTNKWIYIVSSALSSLPPPNSCTDPRAANPSLCVGSWSSANMPQIVITNGNGPAIGMAGDHWRLVGLEITAASTIPSGCPDTTNNCTTNWLISSSPVSPIPATLPDSFVFDRCYIHGTPRQNILYGIINYSTHFALVDSNVSDIRQKTSLAIAYYNPFEPGPVKLVNSVLNASGWAIMFGSSGHAGLIPSDIEIQHNYLYKPMSWMPLSFAPLKATVDGLKTLGAMEVKSAQRLLFNANTVENNWSGEGTVGRVSYVFALTVRSSENGDNAVDNDFTFTNNAFLNVGGFAVTEGADDLCDPAKRCNNAGSQDRWVIYNNYGTYYDGRDISGTKTAFMDMRQGINRPAGTTPATLGWMRNVLIQHNHFIAAPGVPNCRFGINFGDAAGFLPAPHFSENIWILDNAFCAQTSGATGLQGIAGLNHYMPYPSTAGSDIQARYCGNAMYGQGGTLQTWPTCTAISAPNLATNTTFTYDVNHILTNPVWTSTAGPATQPFQTGYMGTGQVIERSGRRPTPSESR